MNAAGIDINIFKKEGKIMKKMKKLVVAVMLLCMLAGMTVCAGASRCGIIWVNGAYHYDGTTGDGEKVAMFPEVSNPSQMAEKDMIKSLTGWDDFTAYYFDYSLWSEGQLMENGEWSDWEEIDSLGAPITIPIYFTSDSDVKEGDETKVILWNQGSWEVIASAPIKMMEMETVGTEKGVNAVFSIPKSTAAVIIRKSSSGSGSGSHSGGSSGSSSGGGSGSGSDPAPYVVPAD